jgi:hypothetical protein
MEDIEKRNAYAMEYYQKNKERLKESNKKSFKKWYAGHKEEHRKRCDKWIENNKEEYNKRCNKYNKKRYAEKIKKTYNYNCIICNIPFETHRIRNRICGNTECKKRHRYNLWKQWVENNKDRRRQIARDSLRRKKNNKI